MTTDLINKILVEVAGKQVDVSLNFVTRLHHKRITGRLTRDNVTHCWQVVEDNETYHTFDDEDVESITFHHGGNEFNCYGIVSINLD